jgi:hypothetical protein
MLEKSGREQRIQNFKGIFLNQSGSIALKKNPKRKTAISFTD